MIKQFPLKSLILGLSLSFSLFSTPSEALIPFTQASGMLENTKDEFKEYSPFWAMVAVHGRMLKNIRFFGNYVTKNDADEGQDVVARLLKHLFNSPDGVQFVATTYDNDPVGNLSRNLHKINDIIEILLSNTRDRKDSEGGMSAEFQDKKREIALEIQKHTKEIKETKDEKTKKQLETEFNQLQIQLKELSQQLKDINKQESNSPKKASPAAQIAQILSDISPKDLDEEKAIKLNQSNKIFAELLVATFKQEQTYIHLQETRTSQMKSWKI